MFFYLKLKNYKIKYLDVRSFCHNNKPRESIDKKHLFQDIFVITMDPKAPKAMSVFKNSLWHKALFAIRWYELNLPLM